MLHLRRACSSPVGDEIMRAMFAARKSVFVDLLKWAVPVIDGRYEIDQFDTESAVYLIVTDTGGEHLASARLLPTNGAHILGDLFPGLCEAPPPRRADTYEITRFCLDRRLRARERRVVRDTLVVALARYAQEHGIAAYTAIAEVGWIQQILAFGWRCRPLGLPTTINGELLTAFRIDIDADTLDVLAAAGIASTPLRAAPAAPLAA